MTTLASLLSLKERTVMVTGGAGHIACAMSEALLEMGADLILVDRDGDRLDKQASKLANPHGRSIHTMVCALEDQNERSRMVEDVLKGPGRLDVLINNAAFVGTTELSGWSVPFTEQSVETWRQAFEVNVTAAFHLSQALLPLLEESGNGSIINIGSIYGELGPDWSLYEGTGMANPAAYGASKGALFQLTRWLATTLAPGVRVNAISPGGVFREQHKDFVARYVGRTPLGRMAVESDFAGPVVFLASDASAYVTGQVLRVDGGWGVW